MELVIQEIKKNFGEKTVLKGISFRAVGGKAFGLLGRNGACLLYTSGWCTL